MPIGVQVRLDIRARADLFFELHAAGGASERGEKEVTDGGCAARRPDDVGESW